CDARERSWRFQLQWDVSKSRRCSRSRYRWVIVRGREEEAGRQKWAHLHNCSSFRRAPLNERPKLFLLHREGESGCRQRDRGCPYSAAIHHAGDAIRSSLTHAGEGIDAHSLGANLFSSNKELHHDLGLFGFESTLLVDALAVTIHGLIQRAD